MRHHARTLLIASASAAGVLWAVALPVLAEVRLEPFVTLTETYSDNVDEDPEGQEDAAFISEATVGTTLRWMSPSTTTAFDVGLTGRHQTDGDDSGSAFEVLPEVAGTTSFELWPDHLFFDAGASVSNVLLDTREQDTSANRRIVQTYNAGPRLTGRFGSFADAETFYRIDQVIDEDSSGLGDDTEHTIGASLSSGPDFTRILWSLNASASETQRDTDPDISERETTLDLEYVVDRSFSLLGGVGYQTFDDGDPANEFDSIIWNTGFRWRPGSRTDITLTYGERDNTKSFAGDIRYAISPRTRIFASYSEELETGQDSLSQDLSSIAVDPNTGALIDSRTGLPFDASSAITTIDNDTRRTRTLTTGLTGSRGRNSFGITGTTSRSRVQGGSGPKDDEDAYEVGVSFQRQLTPDTNLGVNAGYARNEFTIDDRVDNEYSAGINYGYSIYRNVSAVGTYSYIRQDSTRPINEFVENRVSIGVSVSF